MLRIGIIADSHGKHNNVRKLRILLTKKKIDILVLNGDLCRYGSSEKDITRVLHAACTRTKVPVIAFPGNYEHVTHYRRAMHTAKKKFSNLIDGVRKRNITVNNYDFIILPGASVNAEKCTYHLLPDKRPLRRAKRHIQENRSWYGSGPHEFFFTNELRSQIKAPRKTIILAHEPPVSTKGHGIDVAQPEWLGGQIRIRAGNTKLRDIIKQKKVLALVAGHIHESGRRACTVAGSLTKQRKFARQLLYNPGSSEQGHAGILEVKGKMSRYYNLSI